MKIKYNVCMLPLLIFLLLGGLFWRGLSLNPQKLPSAQLNQVLPVFELPSLKPEQLPLRSIQLRNQMSLLNIWASWCQACTEEQPFLLQLAEQGVPIYGINEKDDPHAALNWLHLWGNPYRQIGQDRYGHVAIELGVYGTPETFLIDAKGRIRYRHTGPLTPAIWQSIFIPRIQHLQEHA